MYSSETVVSSFFRLCVRAFVILFVLFVFVGVNKFVTVNRSCEISGVNVRSRREGCQLSRK